MDFSIDEKFKKRRKHTREKWVAVAQTLSLAISPIDFEDLCAKIPNLTDEDLKHVTRLYPQLLPKVTGFYPHADAVVHLVEDQLGCSIVGANLTAANLACKKIIDDITKPRHDRFLKEILGPHTSSGLVSVAEQQLINLMYDHYADFVREADNGLVSLAGRLNEKLLQRALINEGLREGTDVYPTGTDSEGDLVIAFAGNPPKQLYVEIKSYRARERLLRGLQDINNPNKVGVGFFVDHAEFNARRTTTLIASHADAIYLPDDTYNLISADSKASIGKNQNRFYRLLTNFPGDMKQFAASGALPKW